jgi:hypothetical protein
MSFSASGFAYSNGLTEFVSRFRRRAYRRDALDEAKRLLALRHELLIHERDRRREKRAARARPPDAGRLAIHDQRKVAALGADIGVCPSAGVELGGVEVLVRVEVLLDRVLLVVGNVVQSRESAAAPVLTNLGDRVRRADGGDLAICCSVGGANRESRSNEQKGTLPESRGQTL